MFQAAASGVTLNPQEVLLGEHAGPVEIEMDADAFEALIRGAAMKQGAAGSPLAADSADEVGDKKYTTGGEKDQDQG